MVVVVVRPVTTVVTRIIANTIAIVRAAGSRHEAAVASARQAGRASVRHERVERRSQCLCCEEAHEVGEVSVAAAAAAAAVTKAVDGRR